MKHLGLKFISLIIAVLLYFFVNDKSNISNVSFYVPVRVEGLGKEKMILRPNNRQAIVTLSGPSFLISKIDTKELAFKVGLPEDVQDHYLVKLAGEQLGLPRSIDVVSIEPAEMELVIDTISTVELPVVVPKVGNLPEDRELLDVKHEPEVVTVTCPESEIRRLSNVETAPIDLTTLNSSMDRKIDLLSPSPYCQMSVREVRVTASLSAISAERSLKGISLQLRGATKGRTAAIDKVNLEVSGAEDKIKKLTASQVQAYIKIPDDHHDGKLPVEVKLPDGLSLVYVDPENVNVADKVK